MRREVPHRPVNERELSHQCDRIIEIIEIAFRKILSKNHRSQTLPNRSLVDEDIAPKENLNHHRQNSRSCIQAHSKNLVLLKSHDVTHLIIFIENYAGLLRFHLQKDLVGKCAGMCASENFKLSILVKKKTLFTKDSLDFCE